MNVRISSAVLDEIVRHAAAEPDREVCGLLLGLPDRIGAALPAANLAADPHRSFELDPAALFAAHRAARAGGPAIVGHYHSHPSGPAIPSQHDADAARDGLWMIVAPGDVALFRAVPGGPLLGAFRRLSMICV